MYTVDADWNDVFSGENMVTFLLDVDGVKQWNVSSLSGRHSVQSLTLYWLDEETILTVCLRKV
jgi:hypothetical protein